MKNVFAVVLAGLIAASAQAHESSKITQGLDLLAYQLLGVRFLNASEKQFPSLIDSCARDLGIISLTEAIQTATEVTIYPDGLEFAPGRLLAFRLPDIHTKMTLDNGDVVGNTVQFTRILLSRYSLESGASVMVNYGVYSVSGYPKQLGWQSGGTLYCTGF